MDQGKNTPLSKSEWKRYRPIENGIRCSSLKTFPSSSRNLSGLNSSPFSQWLPCSHFINDLAGCDKVKFEFQSLMVTLRISAKRGKTIVSFGRIIPPTERSLNDGLDRFENKLKFHLVTTWASPVGAMLLILCTSINVA